MSNIQDSNMQVTEERIRQYPRNVLEHGAGIVGTSVMQDPNLHVIAKTIYSYLCAYGDTDCLPRDQICYDLNINKNTYAKYMKQLVDCGYITRIKHGTRITIFTETSTRSILRCRFPCRNWEHSKGVREELAPAARLGKEIIYEPRKAVIV